MLLEVCGVQTIILNLVRTSDHEDDCFANKVLLFAKLNLVGNQPRVMNIAYFLGK